MKLSIIAALAATALAAVAAAHDFRVGSLIIDHPFALETPATAKTAAGYLTITNTGADPDHLIGVESELPRAEIHSTEVGADGVARMRPVEALEIPPGAAVTLEPQGMHVMFMGLSAPFTDGEKIPATLVFEKAGPVEVIFAVEVRADDDASQTDMDHDMEHGGEHGAETDGAHGSHADGG